MQGNVISVNELGYLSTEELKNQVLNLVENRDTDSLSEKVLFQKEILAPYFDELNRRNPLPILEDQVPIVLGVWTPIWSSIPFHDILPGRLHDQSYQIFGDRGYYANMARYAPGSNSGLLQQGLLQKLSNNLPAYDFMVMQKFSIQDNQWLIENVAIEQVLRRRNNPLTIDRAKEWFDSVLGVKLQQAFQKIEVPEAFHLDNIDRNTVKKLEKTYLAKPYLEHLYIDNDFRLVKTQREAKQRPSYTIAVRRGF